MEQSARMRSSSSLDLPHQIDQDEGRNSVSIYPLILLLKNAPGWMSGGMTQTTQERKPLLAGLQPAGISGFEQLHRTCQSNLSVSIFHAPMCAVFSDEVPAPQPSRYSLRVRSEASCKSSQAWAGGKVVETGDSLASSANPSPPRLDNVPPCCCWTSHTGALLTGSLATAGLWGARGGSSQHPQCSQRSAMAPAPLGLRLRHKPGQNASGKCTRSRVQSPSPTG